MKPHRGTLILVLGILSLIICAPAGIFAWLMGNTDLKAMAAGTMDPAGKDITNIGRILGMIGTAFLAIGVVVFVLMFIVSIMGAMAGSH